MPTPTGSDGTQRRRAPSRGARLAMCGWLVLALVAAGCTASESLRDTSAPVVLVAGNVVELSDPFGDVLSASGSIPADNISVEFTARLKNGEDITQPALQDVIIDRYEVTFRRTDGGDSVPAGFQRAMNALVRLTPHGQPAENVTVVELAIVPSTLKSQPPIAHLIDPGFEPDTGFVNIQVTAEVRFFGETVAGEPISTRIAVGIDFADFADTN